MTTTLELLTCSLCASPPSKPKSLTCSHKFCLDCLQNYIDKNDIVDEMPCPLCREMFFIPPQGLSCLPDDFLIKSLIELELSTEVKKYNDTEVKCDRFNEGLGESCCSTAQIFCTECAEHFCRSCADTHDRLSASELHTTVLVKKKSGTPGAEPVVPRGFCDNHNEVLLWYCLDCNMVICNSCLGIEHEGHNTKVINDIVHKIRDSYQTRLSEIERALGGLIKIMQKLNAMKENVRTESLDNQTAIREKCDEMRRALDLYEEELLKDNIKHEDAIVNDIKTKLTEIELQKRKLGNFKIYLKMIEDKRNNGDIAANSTMILTGSESLLNQCKDCLTKDRISVKHSKFTKNNAAEFEKRSIGHFVLSTEDPLELFLCSGNIVNFINHGRPIDGIAVIENEIFVLQQPPPQIHVYDELTLALKRNITTQNLITPQDLAGCSYYKCLYISDSYFNEIQKIDITGKHLRGTWKIVNGYPMGVSVTAWHNVLITIRKKGNNRVIECDTHGQQLRTVNFHGSIRYPTQTVGLRLPDERFLVCHGAGLFCLHRVSMVDAEGMIIKEYGKSGQSGGMLKFPSRPTMILEHNGKYVFVANYERRRIHLLDDALNFIGYVATTSQQVYPLKLFYDSEEGKLYIAEYSRRIMIKPPFCKNSPPE